MNTSLQRFFNLFSALPMALLLCFLPSWVQAQAKPKWEEFRSYEGRFRVLSPGDMRSQTDTIETAIGKLAYHTFFFEDAEQSTENAVYLLSYCDYPAGSLHHDSIALLAEFFDATVQESAFSVAGDVAWSNDMRLGVYPGKSWRVDYKDKRAVIKTRAFVAGNRYYSVQTVMKRERSLNASSDKFLESFRIFE
ncbi:MAG: hypothetical protein KAX50_05270 [Saprospiraceae bacterium]|nr:hypothetical protein [Saprospiraceae bacterium]